MVLWGCPPPQGYLSVSSVSPEEHGIAGPVPRPPGGPLVGLAPPLVHLPHQGEGLLPPRVRDRAPVPVPWPAPLCPPCRPPSPPLRRGHPRRLRPRRGGGWLVPGSWGLGGDEIAGVRVDVVEVVVVVVVVVVGVVCRHLLDAGGDAPHQLHVRLWGRPALCPPPFVLSSPLGSHAPSRLSLGARGALALALGPLSSPLPVSRVPPPVPHALARPLTHLPSPCPLHPGSLPVPLGCSGWVPLAPVFVGPGRAPLPAGDARCPRFPVAVWCCVGCRCAARLDARSCLRLCAVPALDGAGSPVVCVASVACCSCGAATGAGGAKVDGLGDVEDVAADLRACTFVALVAVVAWDHGGRVVMVAVVLRGE